VPATFRSCTASISDMTMADIQCDKAGSANAAVCDAYGEASSICRAAKVQYEAHCKAAGDVGVSLGSDPKDASEAEVEKAEAASKEETPASASTPAELPSLKSVMQPILQKCEEGYTKAKADCKTKVDARYQKYKEEKKQADDEKKAREEEAQLAKKRAEAEKKAEAAAAAAKHNQPGVFPSRALPGGGGSGSAGHHHTTTALSETLADDEALSPDGVFDAVRMLEMD